MPPRAIDLTGYGLPYWLDIERPRYPALADDADADVAIIGAGIAGLKLADYLSQQGLSCVVLEAKQVGEGASSRNQGCIVTGLSVSYGELAAAHSREVARGLVALSHHNQELLEEQMTRHGIACDYEVLGENLLVRGDLPDHKQALAALRRDAAMLTQDGFAADYPRRRGRTRRYRQPPVRRRPLLPPRRAVPLGTLRARSRRRGGALAAGTHLRTVAGSRDRVVGGRRRPLGAHGARQRERRPPVPGDQRPWCRNSCPP